MSTFSFHSCSTVCLGLHSSREISDVGVYVKSGLSFFRGFIMPRRSRYIGDFAISIDSGFAPYQWDEALLDCFFFKQAGLAPVYNAGHPVLGSYQAK